MPHHHHPKGPRGRHHDGEDGGGPRHGKGPEHHAAHRRERVFAAGGLKLLALHLVAAQPSHGYDVIRAIGELVGGDYQPSPGTIYPTLSYLVDMGHATATEQAGGRKQYAITEEGQQFLTEQQEALAKLLERLSHDKERQADERPPALVRAMENFRTALRLKMETRPDAQRVDQIAALLDSVALQIEKV